MILDEKTGAWTSGVSEKVAAVKWCIESTVNSLTLRRGEGINWLEKIDRSEADPDLELMERIVQVVGGIEVERVKSRVDANGVRAYDVSFFYQKERIRICDFSGK